MKTCSSCLKETAKINFRNKKDSADGLHPWCIPCCKTYSKNHYQENKQDYIEKAKSWQSENKDKRKQILSKHKRENRAKHTADTAKYRADKDKRTPNWLTEFDHIHIKALYQLAAMRTRESGFPWHVDHVIPLRGKNVSGLHTPSNMRVIPGEENVRKNNVYAVE